MSDSIELISSAGHEQVSVFQDATTGLLAIIAVHSTVLGPGLGGCRMVHYDNIDDAMKDVLRLSEGMTYKNSLAGLDLGGGKSVIIHDRNFEEGRTEFFKKFAECVASMQGKYITAEDMGTRVSDIDIISDICPYVAGRNIEQGGGGDPSPHTAEGVFQGIRAVLGFAYGSESFEGKKVCVQGVGNVGFTLASKLVAAGAKVIIADNRPEQLERASKELGAEVVDLDKVYDVECDVFAPCAIGAIINSETIPRLNCKIVGGAANNQLREEYDEKLLAERGIVYLPDFAVNAGGVIMCASEWREGGFDSKWVEGKVAAIYDTIGSILNASKKEDSLTGQMALKLAKERIEKRRAKVA